MVDVTDRQREVLAVLWGHEENAHDAQRSFRGLTARQVRDSIYPPDSPMRVKRTAGRGASSFNGSVGAMGNLAAGRILAALEAKRLVERYRDLNDEETSAWVLTDAGRKIVKPATLLELHARGEL